MMLLVDLHLGLLRGYWQLRLVLQRLMALRLL